MTHEEMNVSILLEGTCFQPKTLEVQKACVNLPSQAYSQESCFQSIYLFNLHIFNSTYCVCIKNATDTKHVCP